MHEGGYPVHRGSSRSPEAGEGGGGSHDGGSGRGAGSQAFKLAGLAGALPEAPPPGSKMLTPRSHQRHRSSRVQELREANEVLRQGGPQEWTYVSRQSVSPIAGLARSGRATRPVCLFIWIYPSTYPSIYLSIAYCRSRMSQHLIEATHSLLRSAVGRHSLPLRQDQGWL